MISDIDRLYKSYKVSLYAKFVGWVIYMRSCIESIYKYTVLIVYDEIIILMVYDKWYI